MFWIGGVLAVVEGIDHLASQEPIVDPRWAFAVLGLGAVLDGWSLRTTIRAGRSAKGDLSWRRLVRLTKVPELIVVFLEDLGALIGIGIATIGVALATITGEVVWDALASIAIGVLLMAIGLVVNRETRSLLLGESATQRDGDGDPRCDRVDSRDWRRRQRPDDPRRSGRSRRRRGDRRRTRGRCNRDRRVDREGQSTHPGGGTVPDRHLPGAEIGGAGGSDVAIVAGRARQGG